MNLSPKPVVAWRHALGLSKVNPPETMLILSGDRIRERYDCLFHYDAIAAKA